jgi:hypothetical protein
MMNEADVARAYQAALDAQAAAEAAYQHAVELHGPYPDADTPEAGEARWLECQAERAWEAYDAADADVRYPETSVEGAAYLGSLDADLGPDPHAGIDSGLDAHLDAEWADQLRQAHDAIAEAETAAAEAEAEPEAGS